MRRLLRHGAQILFLVLFVILLAAGRIQLWMGLFAVGVVLALVFGRVYCGWACPINTVTGCISWLKRKLRIPGLSIPAFLKSSWVRYAVLGLFLAAFAFTMATGRKLPVLPALLLVGAATAAFFPEELWHRFLCPFGTILRIASGRPRYAMTVSRESCLSCGRCQRVCPAGAVEKEGSRYVIRAGECLVCMRCSDACTAKAVKYQKTRLTCRR